MIYPPTITTFSGAETLHFITGSRCPNRIADSSPLMYTAPSLS